MLKRVLEVWTAVVTSRINPPHSGLASRAFFGTFHGLSETSLHTYRCSSNREIAVWTNNQADIQTGTQTNKLPPWKTHIPISPDSHAHPSQNIKCYNQTDRFTQRHTFHTTSHTQDTHNTLLLLFNHQLKSKFPLRCCTMRDKGGGDWAAVCACRWRWGGNALHPHHKSQYNTSGRKCGGLKEDRAVQRNTQLVIMSQLCRVNVRESTVVASIQHSTSIVAIVMVVLVRREERTAANCYQHIQSVLDSQIER